MRKCKIIITSPEINLELIIKEINNECILSKKKLNINVTEILNEIEIIISNWKEPTNTKHLVFDGIYVEVYFVNNNINKVFKYDSTTLPQGFKDLYKIIERLQ